MPDDATEGGVEHSSSRQPSIQLACFRYSLHVQLFWYSHDVSNLQRRKVRVSPVQSIERHRILSPTQYSNQGPPGPQSRVVTTILPLLTPQHDPITYAPSTQEEGEEDYNLRFEIRRLKMRIKIRRITGKKKKKEEEEEKEEEEVKKN